MRRNPGRDELPCKNFALRSPLFIGHHKGMGTVEAINSSFRSATILTGRPSSLQVTHRGFTINSVSPKARDMVVMIQSCSWGSAGFARETRLLNGAWCLPDRQSARDSESATATCVNRTMIHHRGFGRYLQRSVAFLKIFSGFLFESFWPNISGKSS